MLIIVCTVLKEIAFANGADVVNRPTNFLLAIPSSYLPAAKEVSLAVAYRVVQMDAPHVAKAGKPVAWLTFKVRSSVVAKVVGFLYVRFFRLSVVYN